MSVMGMSPRGLSIGNRRTMPASSMSANGAHWAKFCSMTAGRNSGRSRRSTICASVTVSLGWNSSRQRGMAFSELTLENLAERIAWQVIHQLYGGEALILAQAVIRPLKQSLRCQASLRSGNDEGHRSLSPASALDADDCDFRDVGVSRKDFLDVRSVHVVPAGNDHVLLAVDDLQKAIGIQTADVSGAEER